MINLKLNKKAEKLIITAGIICFVTLLLIFIVGMISVSKITGATIYSFEKTGNLSKYTQKINLETTQDINYEFKLDKASENFTLKALTISGKYKYNETESIGSIYLADF